MTFAHRLATTRKHPDLASKIGGDAGQISRYEHGRITPSADVIIRLAEVFDVTTDYLLLDDAPRRPRRTPDEAALGDDRIAASPSSTRKTSTSSPASSTPLSPRRD